jgi:hypothetical protein
MWTCESCKAESEDSYAVCWNCGRDREGRQVADANVLKETKDEAESLTPIDGLLADGGASNEAISISKRYADAYASAFGTISMGRFFKKLGIVLGIGIAVIGLFFTFSQGSGIAGAIGIVGGFIVGSQLYSFGILICMQGQVLLANLDTAVNTCEFLSKDERWIILKH